MFASILNGINDFLWGKPFTYFVLFIGLYFTIRSGFFSIFHFKHILKNTFGSMFSEEANQKKKGSVTPFEAVCVAIGGCVGCGNIGGVASAVAVGGPGAVFWMWVWAFFGMTVKCVETTLGCHYRSKDETGRFFGGSTYFMEKGISKQLGFTKFGIGLAIAFGIGFLSQFLGGSQAYTIAEVLNQSFGFNMIGVTVIYSLILFYVVWKGTPRVAAFAAKAVPFMCSIFILGGLALVIANYQNVPHAFAMIFHDAFTGTAAVGGFIGSTVSQAISTGVARSINSNEAGQGSSPLIHGSANTIHPFRQGIWGSFEVFIDTLVVCSITALAVLCSGAWDDGYTGATLTIKAYESVFGHFGSVYIGLMCALFGITTTAGWYTYYIAVMRHGTRYNPILGDRLELLFKFIFPLPNIIIVSSIVLTGNGPDLFWTIVNISLVAPVFTNLLGLFMLREKFFALLKDYKARYMGIGKVDPNFYVFYEDDPVIAEEEEIIRRKIKAVRDAVYQSKNMVLDE